MSSFNFKINSVLPARSSLNSLAGAVNILGSNYPTLVL